jgi:iron complex outermembrane receptor protein
MPRYGIPSDTTYIDMRQTKVMTRNYFAGFGPAQDLYPGWQLWRLPAPGEEPRRLGQHHVQEQGMERPRRTAAQRHRAGAQHRAGRGIPAPRFLGDRGRQLYLNPATSQNIAGYLFTEIQLANPLHVEASGRVEHVRITGTPADNDFTVRNYTPVSGAIGLLYTPVQAVKLGLNFSSTGRAPR